MKITKKLMSAVAICAMLVMVGKTNVFAYGISANVNSSNDRVTTYISGVNGYTVAKVVGYEVHPTTGSEVYYSKSNSTTGGGTVSIGNSADAGYQFKLVYRNVYLTSYGYVGGLEIGSARVSR